MPATDASLDRLVNSTADDISLAFVIVEKLNDLEARYLRRWFVELPVPREIQVSKNHWQRVLRRYRTRDLRHTQTEKKHIRDFAQWTLDEHMKLTGQNLRKLHWSD